VALAGNKCDIPKEKHEIKPEMVSEFIKTQSFEPDNLI
jgi:GTPase SAR1 family protein